MKIYFVEDNPDLLDEVSFQLDRLGYEVLSLDCGAALLEAFKRQGSPHVLLMDLGLPDWDGLDLARLIRQLDPAVPMVFLTSRSGVEQRIEGWTSGADVYLTKPVHLAELDVILKSLVHRRESANPRRTRDWVLDLTHHSLTYKTGQSCTLSYAECSLLLALKKFRGEAVERDVLVKALGERIWDYDMRRLEAAMSRLRRKIRDIGCEDDILRPVRGIGYLLAAQIVVLE